MLVLSLPAPGRKNGGTADIGILSRERSLNPWHQKKEGTTNYRIGKWVVLFALICLVLAGCAPRQNKELKRNEFGEILVDTAPDPNFLSKEESLKAIHLPEGYWLELVASEPDIAEPVAIAWDGDGNMYVAEMRTYMQDIDGSEQDTPRSRISRLEDTNGDGVMDKVTVFVDSLVLPRMMLCIGKKLYISETYTQHIWAYEDSDGDGVADRKELAFENNKVNTHNLEHQRSGMVWNIDNRIYMTIEQARFTYKQGKFIAEEIPFLSGQWGLTYDNYGRLFYSVAGGEAPAVDFQLNPQYGIYRYAWELSDDFKQVYPVISTPDVQGGLFRLRPDSTLNVFTGCCGQSVYRGNALPYSLQGDLFICEPVGRLIRRAGISGHNGMRTLYNADKKEEFMASTDMNFRPVNTATGPDGCLYIVDMHRGIIQEGNWTREGSFLRPQILQKQLDKNTGRGRIYRLRHKDFKPGPRPRLLEASNEMLIGYLAHPNGWWRDNAQKELVSRGSITEAEKQQLEDLFKAASADRPGADGHLAAIHALWTLDGLSQLDKALLLQALQHNDPRICQQAIRISEPLLQQQDPDVLHVIDNAVIGGLLKDFRRVGKADVKVQLTASFSLFPGAGPDSLLQKIFTNEQPGSELPRISESIKTVRQKFLAAKEKR